MTTKTWWAETSRRVSGTGDDAKARHMPVATQLAAEERLSCEHSVLHAAFPMGDTGRWSR